MKVLLTLSIALCSSTFTSSTSVDVEEFDFKEFVALHDKRYDSLEEHNLRQEIYLDNVRSVRVLRVQNPLATFSTLNVPHADLTMHEFRSRNTGYLPSAEQLVVASTTPSRRATFDMLPVKKIDWRDHGAVDPFIFTQGECGCCWAISATQTIGSQYFLHSKQHNLSTVPSLSFQQLICCDCGSVDAGCHGGDPHQAYRYVMNAGGLQTNKAYPFTDSGPDAQSCNLNGKCNKCQFQKKDVVAGITGYVNVTQTDKASGNPGNETKLAETLASKGPISVCIDSDPWRFYQSGILTYGARKLNHCVQLIGMDTTYSTPYWILKNSWGEKWGEKGYIRMQMGSDVCGVADVATMPTVV